MDTTVKHELKVRSDSCCELCGSSNNLRVFKVEPSLGSIDDSIIICSECEEQILDESKLDANHWHCLNETIWSDVPAIQVMAYRILRKIDNHEWSRNLLDMLYLEDEVMSWAENTNKFKN